MRSLGMVLRSRHSNLERRLRGFIASSGTAHPVLPPSVEEAYRKKCIELRRRKEDVEESNDAARLRRVRLIRGIHKMRLERAILLDTLEKRMRKNGAEGALGIYDEESEDSSDSPPTVRMHSLVSFLP